MHIFIGNFNAMPFNDWSFWFQLLGALGSLATFGAFIMLLKKDKNKQEQLDHLTKISQTWARLYELERDKFELERSAHDQERKRIRIDLMPVLRLSSYVKDGKEREFHLVNNGESCIITKISALPEHAALFANRTYPIVLDKSNEISVRFALSGTTHDGDVQVTMYYSDMAKNHYQVSIKDGVLGQPIHLSDL